MCAATMPVSRRVSEVVKEKALKRRRSKEEEEEEGAVVRSMKLDTIGCSQRIILGKANKQASKQRILK